MKSKIEDKLDVTHYQGGYINRVHGPSYMNELRIVSEKYRKNWRIRVGEGVKRGSLKVSKQSVYNYTFGGNHFRIQEVENGIPVSDWEELEYMIALIN